MMKRSFVFIHEFVTMRLMDLLHFVQKYFVGNSLNKLYFSKSFRKKDFVYFGQSFGQSFGQPFGQSFGQSFRQLFGQPFGQSFEYSYEAENILFPYFDIPHRPALLTPGRVLVLPSLDVFLLKLKKSSFPNLA